MSNTKPKYAWRSDGDPAGHMSYCNNPYHSGMYYCSAEEGQGDYSEEWLEDHPVETAEAKLARIRSYAESLQGNTVRIGVPETLLAIIDGKN
jgi:hypothetical protein